MFILNKELSYYVGLAQTDGHFYETTMRKQCPHKTWTSFEDNFILEHSLQESIDTLNRSKQSIKMRLYRLQKSNKIESLY